MEAPITRLALAAAIVAAALALCALSAPTTPSSTGEDDQCGPQDFFYWEGSDCSKFIKCKHGNVTLHSCAKGKFWNHEKAKCDGKQNVTGCAPDGSYLVDLSAPPKPANLEAAGEQTDSQVEAEEARRGGGGGRHNNGGCQGRNCGGGGGGGCQGRNCNNNNYNNNYNKHNHNCPNGNCNNNYNNNNNNYNNCPGGNCYGRRNNGGRRNYGYEDQADGHSEEAQEEAAGGQDQAEPNEANEE